MPKKKTDWEGLEFDETFGSCFSNDRGLTDEPYMKLVYLDERTAKPCKYCGRYPRIHVANFIQRFAHPNHIYMSCICGNCNGQWYPNRDKALEVWNEENKDALPKTPGSIDIYDIMKDILDGLKFPE